MRRPIALASLVCLFSFPLSAEKVVGEISWSALKARGGLLNGEVAPAGRGQPLETLRVTNLEAAPRVVPLLVLDAPGVATPRYLVRGQVGGEGIEGKGYLEMWSFFAGGGRYFSRTLAEVGPMGSLNGTFPLRPFILPFTAEPGMKLERLAVNVAFPGKGTVILGPIRLVELASGDDFFATPGAWLSPREIGRAAGITGGVFGVIGAIIGILASRRAARPIVVGLLYASMGVGIVALAVGGIALSRAQPWEVTFPLLLVGVLAAAIPAGLLGQIKRQYEELEFRRMKALDVR